MRFLLLLVVLLLNIKLFAQQIDVQHYKYEIILNDEDDKIIGKAGINLKALQPLQQIQLHLVQPKNGKGMKVEKVDGSNIKSFHQSNDKIIVALKNTLSKDSIISFTISYLGVPADGLIISKNKYGDRTFFSDNWPNRAHNWIPCNDVPSDKASVEFLVTAPVHYQIISNGIQVEETNINQKNKAYALYGSDTNTNKSNGDWRSTNGRKTI